ncbi:MAG: menaquinone biosynthesis protein [Myxococcales bacterium]|nr:menaquinone biosynthesis protein [Myxococcales bacterium]
MHPSTRLRVCGVEFLNAWPLVEPIHDIEVAAPRFAPGLFHGVEDAGTRALFDPSTALPSECTRRLAQNLCDIALVPVASYVAHPHWDIIPEIGIGCEGPVETVILVSDVPLERVAAVHLDAASRSSATLIRVLLHQRGLRPRFQVAPHREGVARVRDRDAALVIGDAAFNLRARFAHSYDLGALWYEATGLPFVFAFWAARPGLVATAPHHVAALLAARERGRARTAAYAERYRDQLVRVSAMNPAVSPDEVLPAAAYRRYLDHTIRYELDARARAGLSRFLRLVRELGIDTDAPWAATGDGPGERTR